MSIVLDSESPKLFSILASIPGKKTLILDQSLSIFISSLASFTQLQDHGIESVKWLHQTAGIESGPTRVLFISRSDVDAMRKVASLVKGNRGKEFTLLLVPRRTIQVDQALESDGVLADLDIKILPLFYTQEDADLIRVDVPPNPVSEPIVSSEEVFTIAKTLINLQREFGQFDGIRGKGANVRRLTDVLSQLQFDLLIEEKIELQSDDAVLGECIVLDRATDLITPLLTQLTYEGLLYESYPISGSILELPLAIQSAERKITLGPADDIFANLRGENFSNVGPKLSELAGTLSTELDSRHAMHTTSQLKQFVSRIPNLQSSQKLLRVHIELTELLLAKTTSLDFRGVLEVEQSLYGGFPESEIMDPLESLIANESPLSTVLRLLCLWSGVHNGLKLRDHDLFVSRVVQAYGIETLPVLVHLRQHGLLLVRTAMTERGRGGWNGFSRTWSLCPEGEVRERNPEDVSYLYSGYAPLNLRLLEGFMHLRERRRQQQEQRRGQRRGRETQQAESKLSLGAAAAALGVNTVTPATTKAATTATQFETSLRNLRGETVHVTLRKGTGSSVEDDDDDQRQVPDHHDDARRKTYEHVGDADPEVGSANAAVTVIVFLGGCCATELAGVRFVMRRLGRECLIVTRGMVDGGGMMQTFIDPSSVNVTAT